MRLDRPLDLVEQALGEVVRRDQRLAVALRARVAGQVVEHLGDVGADVGVGGEDPEVGVQARGLRVVVARADVRVVAHAGPFAAGDQRALGVRLQRRDAVDDVDARLLEPLRPDDVRLLVEARLELHHADRLLAALGGVDQRADQRRVDAGPVHGLLDRDHVGVVGRLLDEGLDRGREGVVGMVDEDVALAHRREDVGRLAVLALQRRLGDAGEGLVAELLEAGNPDDVPEVVDAEHAVELVDLLLVDPQRGDETLA